MDIYYVTSNTAKFEEASLILNGLSIHHAPLHLEEIQGSSSDVATHKIKKAVSHFNAPCMIDDVSLSCPCIGNLPGPYIRSFLESLGDEGLARLIHHYPDHSCTVTCTIAFSESEDQTPLLFTGCVHGKIVLPRGTRKHTHSWNSIFVPDGHTKTFAEISLEEMSQISPRNKALSAFRNYLL